MTIIKYISALKPGLVKIPIITGQIIECTDTNEIFVDNNNAERVLVENIIILATEYEREQIETPDLSMIYLVKETNMTYKFKYSWMRITDDVILGGAILRELVPATIEENGIATAPRTLTSQVFNDDGTPLSSVLDDMIKEGKRFELKTQMEHYFVERTAQRIFRIPVPFVGYDFTKFPMVVLRNDELVKTEDYVIAEDYNLIFSQSYPVINQDERLTYIFNYAQIISDDSVIDADMVNGYRYIVSVSEPYDRIRGDIWFDTSAKAIKQFDGTGWIVIATGEDGINGGFVARKNTVAITQNVNYIEIGIKFRKGVDFLLVFKNSVFLAENEDYTITEDGINILCPETEIWEGTPENPTVFNIIGLVNVPISEVGVDGSIIDPGSIPWEALSKEIQDMITGAIEKFNDYYTKLEIDNIVNTINNSIDSLSDNLANNYYNKANIDSKINTINNSISSLSNSLSNYYTKGEIDGKITTINNKFGGYYTKTEMDGKVNTINNTITTLDSKIKIQKTAPSSPKTGDVWISWI